MEGWVQCGWVMVLAGLVAVVCGQQSCQTQDGQRGTCSSIQQCPQLQDLLRRIQSGSAEISAFSVLRRSICRIDGRRIFVCCVQSQPLRPNTVPPRPILPPTNPTPNPNPSSPLPDQCGSPFFRDLIHNGEDAPHRAWTFIVVLRLRETPQSPSQFGCGGTLISTRYVLTAAHCIHSPRQLEFVRIGEHTLGRNPDCENSLCAPTPQDIEAEQIIIHEGYNPNSRTCRSCNDIALIRLATPATLNTFVEPLCLPKSLQDLGITGNEINMRGYVAGWGFTETGVASSILQEINVPINYEFCNIDNYPNRNMVVCAGGEDRKDACRGDSGGPLVVRDASNNRNYLLGLVSSGPRQCGALRTQGIYTNVIFYMDWILSKLR